MSIRTLSDIDRDGALVDAVGELCGPTRAELLSGAAIGGAALLGALAAPAQAARKVDDTAILNFGLRFERLQASFYTEAEELGTVARMRTAKQEWAQTLGAHERAHVRILKDVLGEKAEGRPTFDFGEDTETADAFTETAVAFEDLTVALLTGVLPKISDRELRSAFVGLLTVEARHAAWARYLVGANPAPEAFDEARSLGSVENAVARTRFVVRRKPRTVASRRRPRFTG